MPRERSIVASVKAASFLAWLNLALALLGSICVFSAGALPGWVTMCSDTGCPVSFNIWGLDDILTRSKIHYFIWFCVFDLNGSVMPKFFVDKPRGEKYFCFIQSLSAKISDKKISDCQELLSQINWEQGVDEKLYPQRRFLLNSKK